MKRKSGRVPDNHWLVRGASDGWFVCMCGCGFVAVCAHCVSVVPAGVDTCLCDAEERRLGVGQYAPSEKQDGSVSVEANG